MLGMKGGLSILALVGSTLVFTGCGAREHIVQRDATGVYSGAVSLYRTSGCITCHGNNLQGGIGPSLQHVGAELTLAEIRHRIDVGGGAMPGYGPKNQAILTTPQIDSLAAWLHHEK